MNDKTGQYHDWNKICIQFHLDQGRVELRKQECIWKHQIQEYSTSLQETKECKFDSEVWFQQKLLKKCTTQFSA